MFPTAALLVALRLGACPESHPNPHDATTGTPPFSTRWCCAGSNDYSNCYNEDDCEVADATHQCCSTDGTITRCVDDSLASCSPNHSWCPPPAPPASEKLSSGAIGGIVVGAYLGVAAIGGAFAAYRGVAAGV